MTNLDADYRRAVESAVVFDLEGRSLVELAGKEARSFLHNLCTADTNSLAPGQGFEAFLTTAKARVVAHLWGSYLALDADPVILLDTVPGQSAAILKHLDHYLISEQVELADRTCDFSMQRLAGPRAAEALTALGIAIPTVPLQQSRVELADLGVVFVRAHALLSVPSFDLLVSAPLKAALLQKLGGSGVMPADLATHNVLRVEAGTPEFGSDIDDSRFAMEVNRVRRRSATRRAAISARRRS